ncbi:MAG: hypothetical protein ACI85F_000310 [Bacteroidia bacterium]|jgi:hypothetical protein
MEQLKKYLPHLLVLIGMAVLSLAYMNPVLEGKKVWQSDIVHYKGMSKEIVDFRVDNEGEEPLWTNSMFSGMPAYQIGVRYPGNWSKTILKILNFGLPRPANYLFLLMAGSYFMFIVLGVGWQTALVGAAGFAFCSYSFIIMEVGHTSKVHAMAFMAPVLGSVLLAYKGRILLGAGLTAFFLSLQIATNHLQITYYLALILVVLGIVKLVAAIKDGQLAPFIKTSLMLVLAAGIGVAPNASNLWTTAEYGKDTMRGKSDLTAKQGSSGLQIDYATNWSYGKAETGTFIIPNFHGGSSSGSLSDKSEAYDALISNGVPKKSAKDFIEAVPLYWGTQPTTSGPVYLGALVCFLGLFGMFMMKGNDRWWLLGALLLSILLSWGHNLQWFTDIFFNYVPGYNKFRAVSMTLVVAQLIVPMMAAFGLHAYLTSDDAAKPEVRKKLLLAVGITGGFCLLFIVLPGIFFDFSSGSDARMIANGYPEWLVDAIVIDRESILRSDAMRSLVFILLGAGTLFAFHVNKLKAGPVALVLVGLIAVDGISVGKRYLDNDDFVKGKKMDVPYTANSANKQIMADETLSFRVLNLAVSTFNDAGTSYFHQSVGGYHGAKLQRYQELIDSCISKNNMSVLSMLNTKYFIVQDKEVGQRAQLNPSALGNAWFVNEYRIVENADAEMAAIQEFTPRDEAIIDKRFEDRIGGLQITPDPSGQIVLMENKSNHLTYSSNAATDQLAVFSEIFFENGWNAYVDGELKPHARANYVLRSMVVPAGEHTVEFKFEPYSYNVGEKLSMAGSALMLLFLIGGIVVDGKKQKGLTMESDS